MAMAIAGRRGLAAQIVEYLSSKGLTPTETWLDAFLASQSSNNAPPAAQKQTALFRLLAADITTSLLQSPRSTFPDNITDGQIKERTVGGPVPVQVLDIEDVGSSAWSQVEAIEAAERGETTKGREVIRVVPGEDGQSDQARASSGPFKLLLQDAKGTRAFAFELSRIDGIGFGMSVGAKIVLREFVVARGVILMQPHTVSILGGKIDAMHQAWQAGRKAALKAKAGASTASST